MLGHLVSNHPAMPAPTTRKGTWLRRLLTRLFARR
jgi:hypothetical protein